MRQRIPQISVFEIVGQKVGVAIFRPPPPHPTPIDRLDEKLDGAGLTQILNGGLLNIHTDYISHTVKEDWRRVLNLIIFFNNDWKESYKGNLEFWNKKEKKMVKSISPISNRCVIFKTDKDSLHGHPKKLNVPDGMSRKSLAAYYFISEEKKLNLMPTKYYHRPQDSFFYKLAIKFDNWLNDIYSYLKRKKLINNKVASRILNLIKFK